MATSFAMCVQIKPMAEELKHVVVMDGWNRAKEQD